MDTVPIYFPSLFKDDADLRMDNFSAHFITWCEWLFFFFDFFSHLMLKLMFLFFNFQTCSLCVVEVLLCSASNFKHDLCKLNLVLNSFSVSAIYVSWLFEVVSVTVASYTTHLVRHLPSSGQEFFFFCRQLHRLLS